MYREQRLQDQLAYNLPLLQRAKIECHEVKLAKVANNQALAVLFEQKKTDFLSLLMTQQKLY